MNNKVTREKIERIRKALDFESYNVTDLEALAELLLAALDEREELIANLKRTIETFMDGERPDWVESLNWADELLRGGKFEVK